MRISSGQLSTSGLTGTAGMNLARGTTRAAASMLCSALKHIFSTATAVTGRGHMTRSSISRVIPNSCDRGSATAAIPLNMIATAIKPGSRMVAKLPPPAAMGLPCPI